MKIETIQKGSLILAGVLLSSVFYLAGKHAQQGTDSEQSAGVPSPARPDSRFERLDGQSRAGREESPSRTRVRRAGGDRGIEEIMKLNDPLERTRSMLSWIERLTVEEMPGAGEYFRMTGQARKNSLEYQLFLSAWAKVDPEGALTKLRSEKDFDSHGKQILAAWAAQDGEAALAWAQQDLAAGGNPDMANKWIEGIVEGLALSDPEMAGALVSSMPESKAKREAIETMLRELSKEGLEAPKKWVAALPMGASRDEAVQQLAQQLARFEPREALKWAESMGESGILNAAEPIVENWAAENLEEAKAWAEDQSADVLASTAPALIKEMLKKDEWNQASEWLTPHDGDPRFDEAIEQLVRQANREQPEFAADWAKRIADPLKREQGLQNLFQKWKGFDPAGAQRYLDTHEVPESVRKHFSSGRLGSSEGME
jgi:hypothetical protein